MRDSQIILSGSFPKVAGLTYTFGYMYDGANEDWLVRQTGLQYEVPKLHERFFVGRQKEGISTSKIMTGTLGWNMERATANDAFLPILGVAVLHTRCGPQTENPAVYC